MPVFPDVGSISTVSAWITPAFSIAMIIAAPMRSFTARGGVKIFQLGENGRVHPVLLRQSAQTDNRGIADRIDDTIENPATAGTVHCTRG